MFQAYFNFLVILLRNKEFFEYCIKHDIENIQTNFLSQIFVIISYPNAITDVR